MYLDGYLPDKCSVNNKLLHMKKLFKAILLFILLFAVLIACKKDTPSGTAPIAAPPLYPIPPTVPGPEQPTPPPTAPPASGLQPYSGIWKGTATVRDSFPTLCHFLDPSLEITMNWTVLGDSVHVAEIVKSDPGDFTYYYWRGIIKDDTLEMVSRRGITCFGELGLKEMRIKAAIASLSDRYRLQASTVYSMCLPDCIFEFTYNLSKAK